MSNQVNLEWEVYKGTLILSNPPHKEVSVNQDYVLERLKQLDVSFAIWTSNWEDRKNTLCWYIVKDHYLGLEEFRSNTRNQIRKGLKNCMVKRIDYQFMIENAYEVYKSAKEGYSADSDNLLQKSVFNQNIIDIKDTREFWGIFSSKNEFIGYCNVLIIDDWCAYSAIKIAPAFRNLYPVYALIHTMNDHYLNKRRMSYVSAGMKSISHDTNFQEMLVSKFNFRKAYCKLNIVYRRYLRFFIILAYPFRHILGHFNRGIFYKANLVLKLEDIRRQQS